jgi:hypothetical protein
MEGHCAQQGDCKSYNSGLTHLGNLQRIGVAGRSHEHKHGEQNTGTIPHHVIQDGVDNTGAGPRPKAHTFDITWLRGVQAE